MGDRWRITAERFAIGAAMLVTLAACGSSAAASRRAVFAALLADATIVEVGGPSPVRAVIGSPWRLSAVAHVLAPTRDGTRLVALVERERRDQVVILDTARLAVRGRYVLPAGHFRSLSVGAVTGAIYAGGNASGGRPEVAVISPRTGGLRVARLRTPGSGDWFVYRLVAEERRGAIVVSFHGTTTTGAEAYSDSTFSPLHCAAPAHRLGIACMGAAHGDVVPSGPGIIATTGTPPSVVESRLDGRVVRTIGTGLAGDHLMELALGPGGVAYAIGSCGYTGGLSRIDLRRDTHQLIAPPRQGKPARICGERTAARGGDLAIASNPFPVPRVHGRSTLLVVDAASGKIVERLPLASDVLDVAAVGSPRGPAQ